MKKLTLGIVLTILMVYGYNAVFAQAKVIVKERPVTVMKEGDVYVVPDTAVSARYYTYIDSGTNYICTETTPTELVDVQGSTVYFQISGNKKQVYCYPDTYFTFEY